MLFRSTATVLGGWIPAQRDGWMWDLTVPGNNDHDFYIDTIATAVLVHNCAASNVPRSGGVYSLRDPETGAVVRTGRATSLYERMLDHARDPELKDFDFQVEYYSGDADTRVGLEQALYERYPEALPENGGFNKYRPIGPGNSKEGVYRQAATDFLENLGEGG